MMRPSAISACLLNSVTGSARQHGRHIGLVLVARGFGDANAISIPPIGLSKLRERWHAMQAAMCACRNKPSTDERMRLACRCALTSAVASIKMDSSTVQPVPTMALR
jgi:hypothetical protein